MDVLDAKRAIPALAELPDAVLKVELLRRSEIRNSDLSIRESTCGSSKRGEYNTPLHVMALFLILVLSTLGIENLPLYRIVHL